MNPPRRPRRGGPAERALYGWQENSACGPKDFPLFFAPDREQPPDREVRERKAKRICRRCPVRDACLSYALSRPEKDGFWGGLNEDERVAERRRRMRAAASGVAS